MSKPEDQKGRIFAAIIMAPLIGSIFSLFSTSLFANTTNGDGLIFIGMLFITYPSIILIGLPIHYKLRENPKLDKVIAYVFIGALAGVSLTSLFILMTSSHRTSETILAFGIYSSLNGAVTAMSARMIVGPYTQKNEGNYIICQALLYLLYFVIQMQSQVKS